MDISLRSFENDSLGYVVAEICLYSMRIISTQKFMRDLPTDCPFQPVISRSFSSLHCMQLRMPLYSDVAVQILAYLGYQGVSYIEPRLEYHLQDRILCALSRNSAIVKSHSRYHFPCLDRYFELVRPKALSGEHRQWFFAPIDYRKACFLCCDFQ